MTSEQSPTPGPGSAADQALASYGVLTEPPRDLQALVELAALVCSVPHAAINLITSTHQHQVAVTGIDPSVCARTDSMCASVLEDSDLVYAQDARADPRFASNPFVSGELGEVRFYASAPLRTPEGLAIGRLCVFDTEPRDFSEESATVLRSVADRVLDLLELRLRTHQLEDSLAELSRTQQELRRSNESLSLFAGQVSHDLRSPLTAVLSNAELLASEPDTFADPASADLVTAIINAGQRMAAMIGSILDATQVGASLDRTTVPLERVLAAVLLDLDPAIRSRNATVKSGDLPEVLGDPEHLYTVLLNLLSNAVKFTPAGTAPEISVEADRADGLWRISVHDNGRGIPADLRESLFALHARGDHRVEGSGIGLAIARRAVEAHGGRIGIDTSPAGGTTVWFTLPG